MAISHLQLAAVAAILVAPMAAQTGAGKICPCKRAPGVMRTPPAAARFLQRQVNHGHEPWRAGAYAVASHELSQALGIAKPGTNTLGLRLRLVRRTEYERVLACNTGSAGWFITLVRYKWLLPLAGRLSNEVWIATSITCRPLPNRKAEAVNALSAFTRVQRSIPYVLSLVVVWPAALVPASVGPGPRCDCPSAPPEPKINRSAVRKLQQWVNDGHEPWWLDSRSVASHDISVALGSKTLPAGSLNPPLRYLGGSEKRAVYAYDCRASEWIITLRRFRWLLPLAKQWRWEVWTVVRLQCQPARVPSHIPAPSRPRVPVANSLAVNVRSPGVDRIVRAAQ